MLYKYLLDWYTKVNKFFGASIVILALFIVIAILVSPKVGFNNGINNSPISKVDSLAFLDINNSHYPAFNQIMIWLTQFGREIFWPIAIILLFVLGGWTGKKTAVVIAISMLVLVPLGVLAKDIVARPRPVIPQSDFLIAPDQEYAFPSGHALIVSAGAAVALILFRSSSCMSIQNICWWSLSVGCSGWYFIGSWSVSYFCRHRKADRITNYANKEDA
jgi:membrane-associated phospholipid phosphatase